MEFELAELKLLVDWVQAAEFIITVTILFMKQLADMPEKYCRTKLITKRIPVNVEYDQMIEQGVGRCVCGIDCRGEK